MNIEAMRLFWSHGLFTIMLSAIGLYCVLMTHNLIRALIGLELLIKAATLLIIIAGHITGHEALAQSLVITLTVIEAVMITVAVGVVLGIQHHNDSLDVKKMRNLKG
jgi:NADH:ubiquinone oxidoreductase subunit K